MTPFLASERFAEIQERFAAWWNGESIRRPAVSMHVKPSRAYAGPVSTHATQRERWFDTEFLINAQVAGLAQRDFVGESFPIFWANVGPELTSTLYGCELEFSQFSSWSKPIIHEPEQWGRILATPPNFGNAYWQQIEAATQRAIDLSEGRFVVGITDLHGNLDILAGLREPQMLCMDLVDCPDVIDRVCKHVSAGFVEGFQRCWKQVSAAGMPATSWTPCTHNGPAYVPSSDFWCMLSGDLARDLVLPRIVQEMQGLERSVFHLDGPGALRHLDLLLGLPQLTAVQWVYGDGNGPAHKWMDVYRRVRAAGKSVQVLAVDMDDAMKVASEIGPDGLWFTIAKPAESVAEAEAFLKALERGP
jgi:hypothetical protein